MAWISLYLLYPWHSCYLGWYNMSIFKNYFKWCLRSWWGWERFRVRESGCDHFFQAFRVPMWCTLQGFCPGGYGSSEILLNWLICGWGKTSNVHWLTQSTLVSPFTKLFAIIVWLGCLSNLFCPHSLLQYQMSSSGPSGLPYPLCPPRPTIHNFILYTEEDDQFSRVGLRPWARQTGPHQTPAPGAHGFSNHLAGGPKVPGQMTLAPN